MGLPVTLLLPNASRAAFGEIQGLWLESTQAGIRLNAGIPNLTLASNFFNLCVPSVDLGCMTGCLQTLSSGFTSCSSGTRLACCWDRGH